MGRLTISLPDDLQTQLDAYAQAQNKPVSQVVAEAVRAFLNAPPAAASPPAPIPAAPVPTPTPSPAGSPAPAPSALPPPAAPTAPAPNTPPLDEDRPAAAEDHRVRRYLEHLYRDLDLMLETVKDLSMQYEDQIPHQPPFEIPEPPWLGRHGRA